MKPRPPVEFEGWSAKAPDLVDPGAYAVGVGLVEGFGYRVMVKVGDNLLHMTPGRARRVARKFEGARARAAGLDGTAPVLREAADYCESLSGPRQ